MGDKAHCTSKPIAYKWLVVCTYVRIEAVSCTGCTNTVCNIEIKLILFKADWFYCLFDNEQKICFFSANVPSYFSLLPENRLLLTDVESILILRLFQCSHSSETNGKVCIVYNTVYSLCMWTLFNFILRLCHVFPGWSNGTKVGKEVGISWTLLTLCNSCLLVEVKLVMWQ